MSTTWSIFDVIGPVMIGPSSSHTAGAAKIGYFSRIINGQQPKKVKLLLHGSFGQVYAGHCTDKAIIGGLLGLLPHDPKIRDAEKLAKKAGMEFIIEPTDLGETVHPNSVRVEMWNADGSFHRVRAKSIGGGKIIIREIDKVDCHLPVDYSSILVMFDKNKASGLDLIDMIRALKVTIVGFEMNNYKDMTLLDVQIREKFDSDIIKKLEKTDGIVWARFLNHISNYDHYK
jgi:L-serine dehydratase